MTLSYKNIYAFNSLERGRIFCMCQRETEMETERWRQTAILTHNFFSWPYHTVLSSRPYLSFFQLQPLGWGVLNWRQTVGHCPGRLSRHSPMLPWLTQDRLTQPISYVGICIYYFITSTHFRSTIWLLLLIFAGVFCAENLWLIIRSKVTM